MNHHMPDDAKPIKKYVRHTFASTYCNMYFEKTTLIMLSIVMKRRSTYRRTTVTIYDKLPVN